MSRQPHDSHPGQHRAAPPRITPRGGARLVASCLLLALATGCATWHQRTIAFHDAVRAENYEEANRQLAKSKSQARKKNEILYHMNAGYVKFMLGDSPGSNAALEKAEILAENQRRGIASAAAALVTNPEARPYQPEDIELIMINFYKSMNYLKENDREGALVEARKINLKLEQLNDKYPDHAKRYQRDAFAHLLMGLIYDASGDDNNAFIAYRNAYDIYNSDYAAMFGILPPEQLKKDLLRSAHRNGFTAELAAYERAFGFTYTPAPPAADLVVLWLNGLGPVKEQAVFRFVATTRGGIVTFSDEEQGLVFPFPLGAGTNIANASILSVAFPRYASRPPRYLRAILTTNSVDQPLELVENINDIAIKTLHDRMLREFANTLLRLAVKKGIEHAARQQNEWLGLIAGIVNSATEMADTRNWQTLPHSISYTRVPVAAGENNIMLRCLSPDAPSITRSLRVTAGNRGTHFRVLQTMK
ncbi:MAG: hypothetical protein LBI96_00910 [Odoribacteraceae bacterium]|nr:hypothetical protein [Odoribacteraceae bacterium]